MKVWKNVLTITMTLVLLDVMLPEVDGFTMSRELRKHRVDVPIIFLNGKDMMKRDRLYGYNLGGE